MHAFGKRQRGEHLGCVGVGDIEEDQAREKIADDGETVADEYVVDHIAEITLVLPGARDQGRGRVGDIDNAQARIQPVQPVREIEAIAVEEEIVDALPAFLVKPRELDGIGWVGDVEDQQPEAGFEILYANDG